MALRCACGLPKVIETSPRLDDETPFPTTWWMTCRRLVSAIGRLEESGWIAAINERLMTDSDFRSKLARTTADYVSRRDAIDNLGQSAHPGGGPLRIKCLHAHAADYVVNGTNPVGALVMEHLAWIEPTDRCVPES
ncbi:MAG: DUF501 domain-containing protein [Actinomycetota bacterium]